VHVCEDDVDEDGNDIETCWLEQMTYYEMLNGSNDEDRTCTPA